MAGGKRSPVWPLFPGFGYEGAYQPVLADHMMAEKAQRDAAKKGRQSARTRAEAKGAGWGRGTLAGLSLKSDEAITQAKLARKRRGG